MLVLRCALSDLSWVSFYATQYACLCEGAGLLNRHQLLIFCWMLAVYHTFCLMPLLMHSSSFSSSPLTTLLITSTCIQTSASRLKVLLAFRFAYSFLTCTAVLPLPSKHLPANTSREKGKKKKTTFIAFSRQWLSKTSTGTQELTAYFPQCKPDVKH